MPFWLAVTDSRGSLAVCGSQGLWTFVGLVFLTEFLWIFLSLPSRSSIHSELAGVIRLEKLLME